MTHKTTYCALALSFMIVLTPRVVSPGADESHRTWKAPAARGIGGSRKVIAAAVQSSHHTLRENTPSAGLTEPREELREWEEAEQFMQLKAAVYAGLSRLDRSRHATPKGVVVPDPESELSR